jgi:hypothetical protein
MRPWSEIIRLRDDVDSLLMEAGWQRFRPATPGRALRAGYELSCTTTPLVHDVAGAIILRHCPSDADASRAVHGYWQTLRHSATPLDFRVVGEASGRRKGGLLLVIALRRSRQRKPGAA